MSGTEIRCRLHPYQYYVIRTFARSGARYGIFRCGRRWGKSWLLQVLAARELLRGGNVLYCTPMWRYVIPFERDFRRNFGHVMRRIVSGRAESETGGVMTYGTYADGTFGRGERADLIIYDECAFRGTVEDVLRYHYEAVTLPTMSTSRYGRVIFASTPNGKQGSYYELAAQNYKHPLWWQCRCETSQNPFVSRQFLDDAKSTMHPMLYEQEYEGRFVDLRGASFYSLSAFSRVADQPWDQYDIIYAVIDTAYKAGRYNDSTSWIIFGGQTAAERDEFGSARMVIKALHALEYHKMHVESNILRDQVVPLIERLRAYKRFAGVWIEDKGSGMTLIQELRPQYGGWIQALGAQEGTTLSKTDRAITASEHIYTGKISLTQHICEMTSDFGGETANHLLRELRNYRAYVAVQQDDLVDCLNYGILLAFGGGGII